jgi:hypothetical protein
MFYWSAHGAGESKGGDGEKEGGCGSAAALPHAVALVGAPSVYHYTEGSIKLILNS